MGPGAPLDIFRRGLLEGQAVAVASGGPVADAAAAACEALGAAVERHDGDPLDDAAAADFAGGVVERRGRLDTLVLDAASAFASAVPGAAGADALRAAADPAWAAARAAAVAAMIDADAGGKIVLIAPAPGAGDAGGGHPRRAREPRPHALDRVVALRDPHDRDPPGRRDLPGGGRHRRGLPGVPGW